MGYSHKSHGKEHKETQSPMLKVFKDIMQKENKDPEKATLLKEKQKDKKRKYSESRNKSEKSYDSGSTDRHKRKHKSHVADKEERREESKARSHFQGEKIDNWWFKNDNEKARADAADSCSCVSCALKKIVGSEYTCVACLLALFSLSVVVSFLVFFRNSPSMDVKNCEKVPSKGLMKEKRQLKLMDLEGTNLNGLKNLLGYSGYLGTDTGDTNYRQSNNLDLNGISADLSSVLDADTLAETRKSKRLRDFYKKLIQTDAQIKMLKEALNGNYQNDIKSIADRYKRSMSNVKRPPAKYHKRNVGKPYFKRVKKSKDGDSGLIQGYIVREKNYYVKYEPSDKRRNFPKCYHAHDEKSHDRKLKHPFYKNSQRIDEMLHRYVTLPKLQKNISEFEGIKSNISEIVGKVEKQKNSLVDLNKVKIKGERSDEPYSNINHIDSAIDLATLPIELLELQLKKARTNNKQKQADTKSISNRIGRKLMQMEDDDKEDLGYEDLKEVLAEDQEPHDDTDRQIDRKRRDDRDEPYLNPRPPDHNLLNLNWKGPMPLYPEEINSMIKQAAMHNLNIHLPEHFKDIKTDTKKEESDISDTEYVEDYIGNKYDKLVGLAQAYSDYGVLSDKGQTTKGDERTNEGYSPNKSLRNLELQRIRKGTQSEGIRIEFRPGKCSHSNFYNTIRKHMKFLRPSSPAPGQPQADQPATASPNSEVTKVFSGPHINLPIRGDITTDKIEDKTLFITFRGASRKLLAVNDSKDDPVNHANSSMGLGDFLGVMSEWFFKMAQLSGDLENNGTSLNGISLTDAAENNTKYLAYPMYDSGMIDNISHRSRVLMSIAENNTAVDERATTTANMGADATYLTDTTKHIPLNETQTKEIDNKTLVKRSLNNFIFWNDLYDEDEYGMKVDYLDNVMRGKESAKNEYMNALVKSKDWMQDKMKLMTNRIRSNIGRKWKSRETKSVKITSRKPETGQMKQNQPSRRTRNVDVKSGDVNYSFKVLNANLKHICKEAAEAVRNTRRIEAREEKPESAAATGLMQQLVRLMSDLVDIQVQQKTCAKLPPDLREFLDWLTAPSENFQRVNNVPTTSDYSKIFGEDKFDKSTEFNLDFPTLAESDPQDDKDGYLESLRAIQDLIQQYEDSTDEEKSKMSGVKGYLDNQLEFLNNKMNNLNNNNWNYKKREVRVKRDGGQTRKTRPRRWFSRFIKNFKRNHTSSTTTPPTSNSVAKVKQLNNNGFDPNNEVKDANVNRNLNEVYFKTVDEDKKTTQKLKKK